MALALCGAVSYATEPGSEALPFIRVKADAAVLGLGGTGIGNNTVYSVLGGDRLSVRAGGARWMPDINSTTYMGLGGMYNLGNVAFSVDVMSGKGARIESEDYTPGSLFLQAGGAYRLTDNISFGADLVYASENLLKDYSYSAFAVNAFVAGRFGGFCFAAGLSSLGSAVSSSTSGKFSLPSSATLDAAYTFRFGESSFKAAATMDYFFSGTLAASVGAEYKVYDIISARVGYHAGGESVIPSFASAGFGMQYSGVSFDLAYLFGSESLNGTFALTLGYRF